MTKTEEGLVKALGLGALVIYGIGDILGAGIYSIVGKIAGHSGPLTWLSFAIALSIVFLTALTYSELSSRIPKSGGVSIYIQEAFEYKWLSIFTGLLLFSAALFSMSTLAQAFVGYLGTLGAKFPRWLGHLFFLIILLGINFRGIKQSSIANIISTFIELLGLLIVLGFGYLYLVQSNTSVSTLLPTAMPSMSELFKGSALAFFAFTGFEDLANVAEETKEAERNLPRAILSSIGIAGLLYLSVSFVATAIIPGKELSQSQAPLFDVVKKAYPALPTSLFSLIAIFAVSNTTLLNYITASRLLYGMSKDNLLPKFLQTIHKSYKTPYVAILIIFPIVFLLSQLGTLEDLAGSTSTIVLIIFSFSNLALIKIKFKDREKKHQQKTFQIPIIVPFLGLFLNIIAISYLPSQNIRNAFIFIIIILLVSWIVLAVETKLTKNTK